MAVADDPGEGLSDVPAPSEPTGVVYPPVAPRIDASDRLQRLRERGGGHRAGIEARRADSASIDTAFEAVGRGCPDRWRRAGGSGGVPPLHVPGALRIRHGDRLRVGVDRGRTGSGGRRPLCGHRRASRQCGRQHQHPVLVEPHRRGW